MGRSANEIADTLAGWPNIRHRFCTRRGGVSTGLYSSLNCGFGSLDDPQNVQANRIQALSYIDLPEAQLLTCHQTHSTEALFVTEPWTLKQAPTADGMVTNRPGLALGILTADCAPVLLADPIAGIIGAAHAGWRGAINGITDVTLKTMFAHGAKKADTIAVIGPCIGQKSYEVGGEFRNRFVNDDQLNDSFFISSTSPGKFLFSLSLYLRHRLQRSGVRNISHLDSDTCIEDDRFFSYRRSLLRGDVDYGREISLIALAH